jgi:signal transduction histidine kinase
MLVLRVGNSGQGIPSDAHEHIFERFHRASVGENVPGHGLGLNIARELALLHGGDLQLIRSGDDWTEFEVSFRLAPPPSSA